LSSFELNSSKGKIKGKSKGIPKGKPMAIYQSRNPLGFKNLLTWQQADIIFSKIKILASKLPKIHPKTNQFTNRLVDHLIDSARSIKRNIEEGFKRATTSEYIKFLGFSLGSLEELHGDLVDLEKNIVQWDNQRVSTDNNSKGFEGISKGEIGELIRLCRGEDKMLQNQIRGLEKRRVKLGYRSFREQEQLLKQRVIEGKQREEKLLRDFQRETGLVRLINGQFISKDEYDKRIQSGESLELWPDS
jgi:four helix bundle protein